MKKHHVFAELLALTPFAASPASAQTESLAYRAYIGGLPLGTLNLKIATDQDRYATEAQFEAGFLLRWAVDANGGASSSGSLSNGAHVPSNFKYWLWDGKKQRNAEMLFDAQGNASEIRANPEFDSKSYDISSLDEVQQAVDPASAVALLTAPRAAPCELDITVFDGRKLHRITLSPGSGTAEAPRCKGRYERLAGFKAKYMTPERRSYPFDAELMQIAPNRWGARRLSADTKFGNAVVLLQ